MLAARMGRCHRQNPLTHHECRWNRHEMQINTAADRRLALVRELPHLFTPHPPSSFSSMPSPLSTSPISSRHAACQHHERDTQGVGRQYSRAGELVRSLWLVGSLG
jgi:hypothetical protein